MIQQTKTLAFATTAILLTDACFVSMRSLCAGDALMLKAGGVHRAMLDSCENGDNTAKTASSFKLKAES
ncbi:hypothetical protein [Rhodopirellula europaea]|uniref:hypothetical protein n=1 Tax=Rhodopirellula europaea TaxID=1263866 RepID=UPI000586F52A|nr:hypothetical protein [Rhodopirellula europaea]